VEATMSGRTTAAILSGIVESVPVPAASDSTSIPRGSRA
jgi:hypothetical protein